MPKGAVIQAGQSCAASATETHIEITAASTRLARIDRIKVSQVTHKTSEQYALLGQRVTTTGTGTAYTPLLDEPNAGAIGAVVEINSSVEPTYTASTITFDQGWNSLGGRDWPGLNIWIAPSALYGIYSVIPSGATTHTPKVDCHIEEWG